MDTPSLTNALLDSIEAAAQAATPGPWRVGDPYVKAATGIFHNDPAVCVYCGMGPLVRAEPMDTGGEWHTHHIEARVSADIDEARHLIVAESVHAVVAGQYDVESGGIVKPADAEYIALVDPTVALALVAEVRRLRMVAEVLRLRAALPEHGHATPDDGRKS